MLFHAVSLGLVLFATWLLLSGHFDPLLIGFGVASCVIVVLISRAMDVIDQEGHPIHLTLRGFGYWPWLAVEIVKSSIAVTRCILHPRMPITPRMIRVPAHAESEVGLVTYANSITLTPGTVTIEIEDDGILVHALTKEGADSLEEGEMGRRVHRFEGP